MPPHNVPMVMIGASLLWVGWFGFNVGSDLEANGFAGMVFANTILATAAAALAWSFAEWIHRGKPTMLGAASGAVAGLVAITPACGWVGPMGAIAIGLIAGLVCLWAVDRAEARAGLRRLARRVRRALRRRHRRRAADGRVLRPVRSAARASTTTWPMRWRPMTWPPSSRRSCGACGRAGLVGRRRRDRLQARRPGIGLRVPEEPEREGLDTVRTASAPTTDGVCQGRPVLVRSPSPPLAGASAPAFFAPAPGCSRPGRADFFQSNGYA